MYSLRFAIAFADAIISCCCYADFLDALGPDIFLAIFCCNIEVFLFQKLKMYWCHLLGPKFCPYYGVFLLCP